MEPIRAHIVHQLVRSLIQIAGARCWLRRPANVGEAHTVLVRSAFSLAFRLALKLWVGEVVAVDWNLADMQ